ncbi:MAG: GAF domain-containing protein [Chlorobi bacterium]|nr:GAF domain-containing protein [Chlorobiota bacterium]
MYKKFIRKISATIFFISATVISGLIFIETTNLSETKKFAYFGLLFFSLLMLFLLSFTLQINIIYKDKKNKPSEKRGKESVTKQTEINKTEEKIKSFISETEKLSLAESSFPENVLKAFAKTFYIVQGIVYLKDKEKFKISAGYAMYNKDKNLSFSEGEGIPGQVAKNKRIKIITDIPDDYIKVVSGLGAGTAKNLILIPVIDGNNTVAIIEAASFDNFPEDINKYHNIINKSLAKKFKEIQKNDQ